MINANLPWIESPFFKDILPTKNLTPEQQEIAVAYNRDGYVVLPGFFSHDLIDRVQKDVETKAFNPDFPIKTFRDKRRVQDFWQVSTAAKELACDSSILKLLNVLYGREAIPFQTLNFSEGSQQRAHSDTIHFSALPSRFMCGVWVALEDINDDNGPLFYYPGSHRLPEYNFSHILDTPRRSTYDDYTAYEDFMEQIVKSSGFEKKVFHAKKGDALIWASNIIHGGSPVNLAGSTRWSQVTHYFFKDCFYYTPMLSNMVTQELFLRKHLVNILTGERVKSNYNGVNLNVVNTEKQLYILNQDLKKPAKFSRFLAGMFRDLVNK